LKPPKTKPAHPVKSSAKAGELYARAVSLHMEGKIEEALDQIEKALAAGEKAPEVYAAAGYLKYERHQFEQAAADYSKAVEGEPGNAVSCFNLAVSLQALGKWSEAAEMFEKALAIDANRFESHVGLGLCRLHLGAARPAFEAYERCLRLFPALEPGKLEPVLFGKAVALQLQKKFP
jgi:tetratricopeptide (TPR) repeat protein